MPAEGVAAVKTYTVQAKRWARGWELHIDGVGVTQSHGLTDAETMARSYIAMETETAPDSFALTIVPQVGGGLDEAATAAREATRRAEDAQREAAAKARKVARGLREYGLTGRDISAVLGVSPQRVSQLLRAVKSSSGVAMPHQKGGKIVAKAKGKVDKTRKGANSAA
jgi:DNA-directed RNA polymerase specialized sigma24 family protein